MAQHDYTIEDGPGLNVRGNINSAFQAIATSNSGSVEPQTIYPGQIWLDTTFGVDGTLRMRNLLNTAWIRPPMDSSAKDYTLVASGAWTKPANLKKLEVYLVGAGGGSAGAPVTAAGQSSCGAGGAAGSVIYAVYTDPTVLPASVNYTIGAGGVAGNGSGTAGGAGGNTTFNNLTAAGGGGGGQAGPGAVFAIAANGAPNAPTSTEGASVLARLYTGGPGGQGLLSAHGAPANVAGGGGGGNTFAASKQTPVFISAAGSAGIVGVVPGGGAIGAANSVSQALRAGAAGGAGIIYLREYY